MWRDAVAPNKRQHKVQLDTCCVVVQSELKTMLEKLSEDEDTRVRDEATCCEDVAELLATHTLN